MVKHPAYIRHSPQIREQFSLIVKRHAHNVYDGGAEPPSPTR